MRNTAFPAQISALCACTHTHSTAHPALLPLRAGLYQCHSILSFLLKAPVSLGISSLPRNILTTYSAATFCFLKWHRPNKVKAHQQKQAVLTERSQEHICIQLLLGILTSYTLATIYSGRTTKPVLLCAWQPIYTRSEICGLVHDTFQDVFLFTFSIRSYSHPRTPLSCSVPTPTLPSCPDTIYPTPSRAQLFTSLPAAHLLPQQQQIPS